MVDKKKFEKQPGDASIASYDDSTEVTEMDHSKGERRRAGHDIKDDE